MALKPGQTLGQYTVLAQIGKGGMATVYRAAQPALSREVAIKVLPAALAEDPAFHDRFRQEAMAIAKLRHQNVLTVFDSGEFDGIAYIVTELVEGGTLERKLGRPLPVDETLRLITPIAAALDYAHARGMVHRDVKPANILLGADGTPILSDFGLARMTSAGSGDAVTRLTLAGGAIGTPEYMAPEQVNSSDVGASADVYALAVTLYEMLTGSVPHTAETPLGVLMARMTEPLPLPRDRNPAITEPVQNVLLKGLEKDPKDRYQTAGEMLQALEVANAPSAVPRAAAATAAPQPAGVPVEASPAPRRRPLLAALGAIGVLVVGLGLYLEWSRYQASDPTPPPSLPPSSATVSSAPVPEPSQIPAPRPTEPPAPPTNPPASPQRAAQAIAPATPPPPVASHGRLIYSVIANARTMAATPLQHPGDSVAVKDGALEFASAGAAGVFATLPVSGIGDFVSVMRVTALEGRPTFSFRFHQFLGRDGLVVSIPAYQRLSASDSPVAPAPCCQPFDLFAAPQTPLTTSLLTKSVVAVLAAANEEQTFVFSARGPEFVVQANGHEIAKVSDTRFTSGGMSIVAGSRGSAPSTLRVSQFDIYEPTGSETSSRAVPTPRGRRIYNLADDVATLAKGHQAQTENIVTQHGTALDLTAGLEAGPTVQLPVGGLTDFVAVLRFVTLAGNPSLFFRFHQVPTGGNDALTIPAALRLGPGASGTREAGVRTCCEPLDLFRAPRQTSFPSFLTSQPVATSPMDAGVEQIVEVSVKGPLVVVYAGGREVARGTTTDALGPGGVSLQVTRRKIDPVSQLRLVALELYEAVK